ncbi:hypothetical protein [Haloechinothrix sp. LS1_15]|uniref:hypothetical protein n=1 Tax=Haloechinothrix sp. LS1_15 TaxID=2652248 RepID=UPI0029440F76|nr:hypothetical protein [Haloechinothrix sp. LS1_15]MDV6014628.1 hypothetical protein [Haloechinothrix sp. LS1_15]
MGRHSKVRPRASARSRRRGSDGLDAPDSSGGSHRSGDGRRGIAGWAIAGMVAAALVALGGAGWVWGTNVLNSQAEAQSQDCDAHTTLHVLVAESLAEPASGVAESWNDTDPVVRGHCLTAQVSSADSAIAAESLAEPDTDRDIPAIWIPDSAARYEQLAEARQDRVANDPTSVVDPEADSYPLVRITGPGVDDMQQRAAQQFQQFALDAERRTAWEPTD